MYQESAQAQEKTIAQAQPQAQPQTQPQANRTMNDKKPTRMVCRPHIGFHDS